MGYLILVCTVSIISVIAFTCVPLTGVMGATTYTTVKVNATTNTTLQSGVPKPTKDFLTPYYKGMAYLNAGNYTEAIPYFDKALAINPNYSLTLNNKGAALYGLGMYNESIAYFDKVLAIQPTNALALAGNKLDLAAFSKTNTITKPIGTIATPQNPQTSDFGYYFQNRNLNATGPPPPYLTNAHKLR